MKIKLLLALGTSAVLLTGCSSASPEPKYDELELIQYKLCLDQFLPDRQSRFFAEEITKDAINTCKKFLPIKK
jgi:hypothetical protein